MKRLFTLLSMACILLVACEKSVDDKATTITIDKGESMTLGHAGGNESLNFTITNPNDDYRVTPSFNSYWIYDFKVGQDSITFTVERNNDATERSGVLKLNYGPVSASITITQEANSSMYDYEMNASVFGGEYYGMIATDSFNYYVQLGDAEINEYNDIPNGTYYYFDIFADKRGGDDPILPNGTYTIDNNNSAIAGTYSQKYSKAHINDGSGVPMTEFQIKYGTVTVTDNRFEALVYMQDNTSHHIVYEGELRLANTVNTPEYGSTMTEDLIFNHSNAIMQLYYYGDKYGIGYNCWTLNLMESESPINGDYFSIDFFTDGNDDTMESIMGNYGSTSDLEPKPRCFVEGIMEGTWYLNSWYFYCINDIVDNSRVAPLAGGEMTIESDGNTVTVTLDGVDDRGNKMQGSFECIVIQQYDRSNW